MRLILMGTGGFAVPAFDALRTSDHQIELVVTKPLRIGRGRRSSPPPPVCQWATSHDLPLYTPDSVNSQAAIARLAESAAELYVVCDYGQILSKQVLSQPRLGGINLHGSLLPKYRGAAPVQWAMLRGETVTGVTVIHMTPRLDAGPMLVQVQTEIGPEEDAEHLEARLARLGVDPVLEAITMLQRWDGTSSIGTVQGSEQATRAPRLNKADGRIDWNQSADLIANRVRGLKPWPGTYCQWNGSKGPMRLIIDQASADDVAEIPAGADEPGVVVKVTDEAAWVACGLGYVKLQQLRPAGKRQMSIAEFLRGNQLRVGDKLD